MSRSSLLPRAKHHTILSQHPEQADVNLAQVVLLILAADTH
jgi:hypothetical protein